MLSLPQKRDLVSQPLALLFLALPSCPLFCPHSESESSFLPSEPEGSSSYCIWNLLTTRRASDRGYALSRLWPEKVLFLLQRSWWIIWNYQQKHIPRLTWLVGWNRVFWQVNAIFRLPLSIGKYEKDDVVCDVIDMDASHVLLGRPWQYDVDVRGRDKIDSFTWEGHKY